MIKQNELIIHIEKMISIKNELEKSQYKYDEDKIIQMLVKAEASIIGKTVKVLGIEGIVVDVELLSEYFVVCEANGDEKNHRIAFSDLLKNGGK